MNDLVSRFISGVQQTGLLEFIAVIAGIASVWFSRKENILVYPTGLLNTLLFIYLSLKGHLFGEASVNLYYSVMNIYGWIVWSKKNEQQQSVVIIRQSTKREWIVHLGFFGVCYLVLFCLLNYLQRQNLAPGALPIQDALASASAYTGMWLMTRKKVESWYWWIITNITSIPLYFVKGYVFTSFQFVVLLVLAIAGLVSWQQKAKYAHN